MRRVYRRFRQGSLDKMNLKRYLLFSAGEVLLIIFGLLIAIRVNSWNTERINRITEKEYLQRLSGEVAAEVEIYTQIRDKFIEKEYRLKRIIRIWQSGTQYLSDSLQYINDFKWGGNIGPWYIEPVTWNQLIQTGDLRLLKDHRIVDALYHYNNLVKGIADNYLLHPMQMTNRAREFWMEPFIYEDIDLVTDTEEFSLVPSPVVFEKIWKKKEVYLPLYMEIVFISQMQSKQLQSIIDSGQELLSQLNPFSDVP